MYLYDQRWVFKPELVYVLVKAFVIMIRRYLFLSSIARVALLLEKFQVYGSNGLSTTENSHDVSHA